MKILVTGGTGFLGRRTVERLAGGHQLRLLVRPTSDRSRFPDGVSFAQGDVTDRDSLVRACAGCDAVLHAAALVKIMAPSEQFDRINVGGLENVLEAARDAGVGRVVYVSSFMALGPTENGSTEDGVAGQLDESGSAGDRVWINDYERTKTLSDRLAREAIASGMPLDVVYPGVVYGPGELTEGNIVVRHILDLAHRRLPALLGRPERVWSYSFVEDVAMGLEAVLERAGRGESKEGERFMLGGDNVSQGDFYATVEKVFGIRAPRLRMPDLVAKLSGALMKGAAVLTRTTPKLTPDLVDVYTHDWAYSSKKAQRQLGYHPRPLEEGLATTFEWLKAEGAWPR
ncbi:MAG: NAD-dependent epimerase/dehydratase family protein [Holophagales bacterium]|nr:NAD-dependent epimerase/dehydratase family protein [Holophagales bacterium]